jgi:hypothetical protein
MSCKQARTDLIMQKENVRYGSKDKELFEPYRPLPFLKDDKHRDHDQG